MQLKNTLDAVVNTLNNTHLAFGIAIAGRVGDSATTIMMSYFPEDFYEDNPVINYLTEPLGPVLGELSFELLIWGAVFLTAYGLNKLENHTKLRLGNLGLLGMSYISFDAVHTNVNNLIYALGLTT